MCVCMCVELILLEFYRNWYAYNDDDDDDASDHWSGDNARIQINFSIEQEKKKKRTQIYAG